MNTIHVNSETLGSLFTPNHPTSVPLCEPEIHGHFRPHTQQNIIYCVNYDSRCPNSPHPSRTAHNGPKDFSHFGSKFWNCSNGRSRPQTNSIIYKALKSRVKQVGYNPYLTDFVETPSNRCLRCVERLSFLLRRNPTIGLAGILERRYSLSL